MKIFVILFDLDIGGAQNYTISLINEFVKSGHSVSVSILTDNVLLRERLVRNVEVKVWTRKARLDFNVLRQIRNEIKLGKYDAVIASYIIYQKLSTFLLRNNPLTIYPIHTTIERSRKYFILNYLVFKLKKKNEIYLTSIDSQTNYLCQTYRLGPDYFHQIYNGIDTDKFRFSPDNFNRGLFLQQNGINHTHRIILMVAGYREEKRHIDAIRAFQLLKKEVQDVSLVCVGDNRETEKNVLQEYTDQNCIPDIKLLTGKEAGDVVNFYWSSHLFTLTSNKVETFPISALEAMACGLPCVLTDIGGAKDFVIPGINGTLCKPDNIYDIKEKWISTLGQADAYDRNKIRNIVVEKFSVKRASDEYLSLIENNKI